MPDVRPSGCTGATLQLARGAADLPHLTAKHGVHGDGKLGAPRVSRNGCHSESARWSERATLPRPP